VPCHGCCKLAGSTVWGEEGTSAVAFGWPSPSDWENLSGRIGFGRVGFVGHVCVNVAAAVVRDGSGRSGDVSSRGLVHPPRRVLRLSPGLRAVGPSLFVFSSPTAGAAEHAHARGFSPASFSFSSVFQTTRRSPYQNESWPSDVRRVVCVVVGEGVCERGGHVPAPRSRWQG